MPSACERCERDEPVTDVDDLITALNDGSPEVRRSAAEAIFGFTYLQTAFICTLLAF